MKEKDIQKLRDILFDMYDREVIGLEICPVTCKSAMDYDAMYHDVKVLSKAHPRQPEWKRNNPILVIFSFTYAPVVAYVLYRFLEEDSDNADTT